LFYFDEKQFLQVLAVSLGVCILVVSLEKYHIHRSARTFDKTAVQAAHHRPTSRIGGLSIVLAVLFSQLVLLSSQQGSHWPLFALSLAPIFFVGLAEDLGYQVSPLRRLLAAAASSAVCVILLGIWISRADIPLVGILFTFAPFAILFTIFAASGVCHAFNLIDGVNGLAAALGVVVALSLAAIAAKAGEASIGAAAFLMVPALLGFLILNYPFGRIFLGDAGAYSIGHIHAWLAISLLARVEALTTWALMLVFFWPVADTALAIYRRRRSGKPAGQPDRQHFHQLIMRTLEIAHLGRKRRHIANPLTTLVILPLASAPAISGVLLWNQPLAAFAALVLFSALFFGSYFAGMRFAYGAARRLNKVAQRNRIIAARKRRSSNANAKPLYVASQTLNAAAEPTRLTGAIHRSPGGDVDDRMHSDEAGGQHADEILEQRLTL
jgi:UDP-N-acetylmuramyl pentapeptide phosphotransferase/UDP-N-acetylglucosamine-1-phosphate transferase